MEATVIPNVGAIDTATMPVFVGLMGEYAVSVLINRRCEVQSRVDVSLLPGGDGGKDLEFYGWSLQIKTRAKDYGSFLVKHKTATGRLVPQTADAFVFATWGGMSVHVHGYIDRESLLRCDIVPARRGTHHNYEVSPRQLLPFNRLVSEIRSRQPWH